MVIAAGDKLINSLELLKDFLQVGAGAHLADFGCGATAINSLTAARLVGERGQVYAIDILKTVLSSVESHVRHEGLINIKPVWANVEKIGGTKLPTEALDFVLLINILFQAQEPKVVLEEAKRILKKDGKILIVDWLSRDGGIGPDDSRRIGQDKMEGFIQQVGLQVVQSVPAGAHHYGYIVTK